MAKILSLLVLFGFLVPVAGFWLKGRRNWQRLAFGVMCFMTIGGFLWPANWSLTLMSIEYYRGHSRGFHFYFNEALALALILAQLLEGKRDLRWLPPGLPLYLVFCGVSFLSIFAAPAPLYVCMAAFKAVTLTVIFIAAYNFFKEERDIKFFLCVMAGTLLWETLVVLYHKYGLGIYQIRGTFAHQNSLTMYTGLFGMIFLALGLRLQGRAANWLITAYLGCAVIVESALSRGGLLAFVIGTVGLLGLNSLFGFTARGIKVLALFGVVGLLGAALSVDTVVKRFTEQRNEIGNKTRKLLKESAWQMVRDHPLGIGWNNFALVMNRPFPYGANFDRWALQRGYSIDEKEAKGVVESLYWLILAETGFPSLLLFLAVISRFLWWNFRAVLHFRAPFLRYASLGIGTGCGINYLHSYFERVLVFECNMMVWLLVLAATSRIETWRRASQKLKHV